MGRYLVDVLSKRETPLFLTTGSKEIKGDRWGNVFHYLNLQDADSFENLPDKIDTVIHLAALIPMKDVNITFSQYMDVNAAGIKRIMEASADKGCKRFVYASTQMVIDTPFYLPVDEGHPLVPVSDYGLSKAVGERYCMELSRQLDIAAVSLRFSQIYGAGENPGFVLTNFIGRASSGLPLVIRGAGAIQRDLLYVKDAVRAILCAADAGISGIFNAGGGRGISIKELAETISEIFGNGTSRVEFDGEPDEKGHDFYMDIKAIRAELGFTPEYDLKKGLQDYKSELIKNKELS